MDEIADGLINGDFDFYTGEYMGQGYGFPRTRNKSLPWEQRNGRVGIATKDPKESAYNGVKKYITLKWNGSGNMPTIRSIVSEYFGESNIDLKHKCVEIQKDFKKFIQFVNSKLKTK